MRIVMQQANNPAKLNEELRALPKFRESRIAGDAIEMVIEDSATAQEEQAFRDVVSNHNPASLTAEQQDVAFVEALPGDSSTWTQAQAARAVALVARRLGLRA